ncbi:MAG: hypothetical protein ACIAS6_08460, partial [Phycisphaerales bacterium JB060]
MSASRIRSVIGLVIGASLALGGCVVDDERTDALREERENAPPTLPQDPIARPVISGTTASRVSVAIESMGTLAYDGLTVPLVSPNGRFVATQDHPSPSRTARLAIVAGQGSESSQHATVSISPLTPGVSGVRPSIELFDLEAPIVLGRDTDIEGVLVESPRPDGSRWIGLAQWSESGAGIRWLVRDGSVSAHAVLVGRGDLLYCRRPQAGSRFSQV